MILKINDADIIPLTLLTIVVIIITGYLIKQKVTITPEGKQILKRFGSGLALVFVFIAGMLSEIFKAIFSSKK